MTDLDDLPFGEPSTPPNLGAPPPRRCTRHSWVRETFPDGTVVTSCWRCPAIKDEARSRRGRNVRLRGNHQEREWAKRLGFKRTGHYGGVDDAIEENGLFVGQAKSLATARFPGWMTTELEKLRAAKPSHVPVLGILETPGPGHRPRRLVVVDEADWIALHVGRTNE